MQVNNNATGPIETSLPAPALYSAPVAVSWRRLARLAREQGNTAAYARITMALCQLAMGQGGSTTGLCRGQARHYRAVMRMLYA